MMENWFAIDPRAPTVLGMNKGYATALKSHRVSALRRSGLSHQSLTLQPQAAKVKE
jgi:hypothetical protein